ncbi:MAG: DUF4838 domain-containing protein [Treponema sp.]|jgi:hypothetical protein|nr:DUF4838 domain-containing protein [Treponema sp.]
MVVFDVSKDWVIFVPALPAVRKPAEDMARCLDLLRRLAGLSGKRPALLDAEGPGPDDSVPVILLNAGGDAEGERHGFSWRAGTERIEIYGNSPRGLCKGIYDFLSALGIAWPAPGKEELPAAPEGSPGKRVLFPLRDKEAYTAPDLSPAGRKRLLVPAKTRFKEIEALIPWAARNRIDALIFSLGDRIFRSRGADIRKAAESYALIIERGGWDLSLLLPRRLFLFHRELFRMVSGKRVKDSHFCPTNPDTIKVIMAEAEKYFRAAGDTRIFHLWPERGREDAWCSCPSCRAFSPAEQNRIALNTVADALAAAGSPARLSYYQESGEAEEAVSIAPRPSLFKLDELPPVFRRPPTASRAAGRNGVSGRNAPG